MGHTMVTTGILGQARRAGTRLARAAAPLLLLGAFIHCAAGEGGAEFEATQASEDEGDWLADEAGEVEQLGQLTQALVCNPGSASCNGRVLTSCDASGSTLTVRECATGTTCNAAQAGCISPALGGVCRKDGIPVPCPPPTPASGSGLCRKDGVVVPCTPPPPPSFPTFGGVCIRDGIQVPCR
ncbi:MAG TPA: hypothetical protein VJU61_10700 [Polyangiaceae bacterium]|nr:hypothetical protein [Polyangiaceae bacterium]